MLPTPHNFSELVRNSIEGAPYLLAFLGAVFVSVGLYMHQSQTRIETSSVPVSLIVLDMVAGSGDNANSYAPKFKITSSKNKGVTYLSNLYISPPIHQVGDRVNGWYQKDSGLLRSEEMIASTKSFGVYFGIAGLICAFMGIGLGVVRRIQSSRSFIN